MKHVDQVDVAIAGGGPGGLAAAAAIVRALPDCKVKARPYSLSRSSHAQHMLFLFALQVTKSDIC